ncbi:MAG TPA: hypothetical protein VK423_02775 [Thermoplasmata archaeon]|nr:hypothetical protein [Thermoplasmata archaeon]
MTPTRWLVLFLVAAFAVSGAVLPVFASPAVGSPSADPTVPVAIAGVGSSHAPAAPSVLVSDRPSVLPAAPSPAPVSSGVVPSTSGWHNASFFKDVNVNFYGTGLPLGFRTVPYVNNLPDSTLGFWMNLTAAAPIAFANVTIWGNQFPGTSTSTPLTGFSPTAPTVRPMFVNASDPAQASFFFNDYRFFWPGSTVSFNLTVVGVNSTPSEVKSASNLSVTESYPGGFNDAATWIFNVGSPWASATFSDDISVSTSPNVLGANVFAPNPRQALSVTISSVPVNGVVTPIPTAVLQYTVNLAGSVTTYSEPFGPLNHTVMTLDRPIGPYPGATVSFNITAGLPWYGGEIDLISSDVVQFTWSPNGGWWHPDQGLLANVDLSTSPALPPPTGTVAGEIPTLPTDQPLGVSIHEPIENVTIASAQVVFRFTDSGVTHSGTLPMSAVSANTSAATLPGLPPGSMLTFYLSAKDIYGNPLSSGNFSYTEVGPTNPSLPSGVGLLFVEVADLAGSGLVGGFAYSVTNSTWSDNGSANALGFAAPLLPNSAVPVEIRFGTYSVSVRVYGETQQATIVLSADSPTPTVVFYAESHPVPILPTQTISPESLLAVGGLIAAALVTLPLIYWFEERRSRAEEEQRRITL